MKITIWDISTVGLIIPAKTGIIWHNQVGGTLCSQPELEGVYIPLGFEIKHEDLANGIMYDYAGPYQEDRVQRFLQSEKIDSWFRPCTKEEQVCIPAKGNNKDLVMFEAWIPVLVLDSFEQGYELEHLKPFQGRWGVLVYPNSD